MVGPGLSFSTSVIAWHRRRRARNAGRASPSPMPIAMPMPMQQVPLTHWLEQQQYIPNPSEHRYSTHDTWWVILISLPPSLPHNCTASTGPGSLGPIRTGGDRADANPLGILGPCANPNLSLASTICLSPLVFRSSHQQPDSTPALIPTPEPVWIPATHPDRYPQDTEQALTDTDHRLSPRPLEEIRVLNRCNHAFHASCLASWFQYGQFRCPICQASYSPV